MGDFRGDFERIYKNYLVEYWSIVLFIFILFGFHRLSKIIKNTSLKAIKL